MNRCLETVLIAGLCIITGCETCIISANFNSDGLLCAVPLRHLAFFVFCCVINGHTVLLQEAKKVNLVCEYLCHDSVGLLALHTVYFTSFCLYQVTIFKAGLCNQSRKHLHCCGVRIRETCHDSDINIIFSS